MPATCKATLLDVTQREYDKLASTLAAVGEKEALRVRDEDTSIKDIVAHRAHWIDLFLGWYADGKAGKTVHFPAEGYKWNALKRYNADLRRAQRDIDWATAVSMLDRGHKTLVQFIAGQSDGALYGGPMQGAHNSWTVGRWAEAAGASHYRSATKHIRSVLKSQKR